MQILRLRSDTKQEWTNGFEITQLVTLLISALARACRMWHFVTPILYVKILAYYAGKQM